MIKKLFIVSIIGLLFLVTGCASKDETSSGKASTAKSGGKVVVTFWHSMSGEAQKTLDSIVKDYNNSQGKVQVNAEFQGTYEESLPKFFTVGGTKDAPTIIQVQEIGTKAMINSGFIEPIQKFIDEDQYDMSGLEKNIINYYKVDHKFYSMPFNSSTPVMYYNKDAFKKAGLDPNKPPETFEDVEADAKKIVASDKKMKGFALQAYGWLYEELLANQGGLLMNNNNGRTDTPTAVDFDNEKGKSIFEWVKKMSDEGTFANYGTNGDNMVSGFLAGDVAMFLQSSASSRDVIDNAPFDVGVAFLPHPKAEERQGVAIGGASLWMAKGKSDAEQKAAWDFMKYLQTPEVQAKWHVGTGYFAINPAAYKEQTVQDAYKKMPQLQVSVQQLQATKSSYATQGALMDMIPEERKIMETALEDVYNGADVDKTFNNAVKQVNAAIEKSNASRGK
ncbi:sn-glycerol 3-phosphate transport system substrate-binding protein [Pullulanibacillus pueri]|uniref:ABC transporter substrate-binding protein n=1 Tax=Pullulanibacillus pueri TaxID=1437324 RepID=A0A8J3A043_9BACL|nr:ABC transporter substrate-binding protein [Pullulanibacillus pueri]MBM7683896.1 sn-glycerol 3-phosphate transport system substrate-binding protein [Pullulanibacillus pueri]GGH87845.1 ABC transporter substrate-binding protein [Pullulanibacillus pueri]